MSGVARIRLVEDPEVRGLFLVEKLPEPEQEAKNTRNSHADLPGFYSGSERAKPSAVIIRRRRKILLLGRVFRPRRRKFRRPETAVPLANH